LEKQIQKDISQTEFMVYLIKRKNNFMGLTKMMLKRQLTVRIIALKLSIASVKSMDLLTDLMISMILTITTAIMMSMAKGQVP
jgi:hypothetical protein